MPPPLDGVRVLDFTRIIAGPLCTQHLADLGAEVIKVEHPVTGDESRARSENGTDRGSFFFAFNRSKESIAIDLGSGAGRDLARQLARHSDVVIENFRPGVMAKLGLGPDELRAADPSLVYVSISAYGATGDMADRPGLDPVLQAESGMMSLTGPVDGEPTRHPLSLIDTLTASHAATAICAALLARAEHGRGDHVDLALLDTAIGALGNAGLAYLTTGRVPERSGNRHMVATPIDLFHTATEPIYLAASTDRLFAELCTVLDRADLASDERFATARARTRHRDELTREIEASLVQRPAAEWLEALRGLPAGAVRSIDQALQAPEVLDRGMVQEIPEEDGSIRVLGTPFKFAVNEVAAFRPPPRLGEHADAVLKRVLGMDDTGIAALRAERVIV